MKNQIKQLEDSKKVALETTKGFMESKTADKNSVNQEKKIKKKRGGRSPSIDKEGKKKEEKEMKKQLEGSTSNFVTISKIFFFGFTTKYSTKYPNFQSTC